MLARTFPFSQQHLGEIFASQATTHWERVFLEFEDSTTATYGQCGETSSSIANALLDIGLKNGDTLATFLPNCLDSMHLWIGVAKAGIVEVPINLANKGTFLSHIINNSGCETSSGRRIRAAVAPSGERVRALSR